MFGEDLFVPDADIEDSAAAADEAGFQPQLVFDLGRQTGGPWLVISNRAVLDRDLHAL